MLLWIRASARLGKSTAHQKDPTRPAVSQMLSTNHTAITSWPLMWCLDPFPASNMSTDCSLTTSYIAPPDECHCNEIMFFTSPVSGFNVVAVLWHCLKRTVYI